MTRVNDHRPTSTPPLVDWRDFALSLAILILAACTLYVGWLVFSDAPMELAARAAQVAK